jgi:hypothetical protein
MDKDKNPLVENLYHFRCPPCKGWWSIADAPMDIKKDWFCPWCGVKITVSSVVEVMDDGNE